MPTDKNRDAKTRDVENRDVTSRDAKNRDAKSRDERRWAALAALAPGTTLRDGLERILRGNTGALIVLGDGPAVDEVCSGGFELRVPFSATRLRELAKMDGAIVLDGGAGYIVRAAVHLVPDPTLPTDESGTRHRTAERVGRQTGCPVISVSKSMRIIALYLDGARYVLEDSAAILSRANQALATLERYKHRLDEVSGALTAHEIEDLATARDVTAVAQRLEMVRRIAGEIEGYKVELGTDGRLLALQLDELIAGSDFERQLVVQDYLPAAGGSPDDQVDRVLEELERLSPEELLDMATVATVLGLGGSGMLDEPVEPRGYRLLAKVPRLPRPAAEQLVTHFGGLHKLLAASVAELQAVDGVAEPQARAVREGLSRLAEVTLLEKYS
ncbi:MAG TPA: DNA integrity scanning diadenylate cyclase DisA [Streptosporangiaceae bacterium]|nr:DNA integrity scanning diadenylate cyclase DisA [Streptosporangiaceae bacterium]